MLLERADDLAVLRAKSDRARESAGGLVLVYGEAGSGKSSLIEAFIDTCSSSTRLLLAACDPLSTPRPLGPLYDLASNLGDGVHRAMREASTPDGIFRAVFEDLADRPAVVVIDDLHWADQGTVDLVRYLLRRIRQTRTLIVGAVRDDELNLSHPIRALLGDVARSPDAISIVVQPLSSDAIATVFGDRVIDVDRVRQLTGGNAFFVNEMAAHDGADLPASVRDAVLSRTTQLDDGAWDLLHLLACSPEAIPDRLLAELRVGLPTLRAVEHAGLTRRSARGLTFRHDLCRMAIASVMPPGAAISIHRQVIEALEACDEVDDAILVHHAIGADDRQRVARHAPLAARAAAHGGAHTQAAAFYRAALLHGNIEGIATEAALLEAMAFECYLVDELDRAKVASRRALELRTQLDDSAGISLDHQALAHYEWYSAHRTAALRHANDAVTVLDESVPGRDPTQGLLAHLGHAHATQAFLAFQATSIAQATTSTERASDLASRANDPSLSVRAAIIEKLLRLLQGDSLAREELLAMLGSPADVIDEIYSAGYSQLTYFDVEHRRLNEAAELFSVSIPITIERDLPICRSWQQGSRARLDLLRGKWDQALLDANRVLNTPSAPLARIWPHLVRGLIALRRDGGGTDDLDEAWALARRYDEPIRLLPALSALAERSWLTGTTDPRLDLAAGLVALTTPGLEWARGELATWMNRLDPTIKVTNPTSLAGPYRLRLEGHAADAAANWQALATPYDHAIALIDVGEPGSTRTALGLLDRLGATAVAAKIRATAHGANPPPIGRRRPTSGPNPAGLTSREIDVLELLDEGLTNAELAERLYISPKTADHHVSAILSKLHVRNRREAVRTARQLNLFG